MQRQRIIGDHRELVRMMTPPAHQWWTSANTDFLTFSERDDVLGVSNAEASAPAATDPDTPTTQPATVTPGASPRSGPSTAAERISADA